MSFSPASPRSSIGTSDSGNVVRVWCIGRTVWPHKRPALALGALELHVLDEVVVADGDGGALQHHRCALRVATHARQRIRRRLRPSGFDIRRHRCRTHSHTARLRAERSCRAAAACDLGAALQEWGGSQAPKPKAADAGAGGRQHAWLLMADGWGAGM